MSTPNPLQNSHSSRPKPLSVKHIHIAGIKTHILGLSELPPGCTTVAILWLLHPRLQKAESMEPIAASIIHAYNVSLAAHSRSSSSNRSQGIKGLIAVSFDQRNHGTRLVSAQGNDAWREGNPMHAQDMFGIYQGTAMDMSLLLDHVGSYLFVGEGEPVIGESLVLGISLGGHSAWQVLFADERVKAGVVIIGCPDYIRLMTDRARLSKLPDYTKSPSPTSFLGTPSFPLSLINACKKHDPKALLHGTSPLSSPPQAPTQAQTKLLQRLLAQKSLLICSGGDDKLVPYHCSEPFLSWLKGVVRGGDVFGESNGVYLEDNVYAGVGHATSEEMVRDAARFVEEVLVGRVGGEEGMRGVVERRTASNL